MAGHGRWYRIRSDSPHSKLIISPPNDTTRQMRQQRGNTLIDVFTFVVYRYRTSPLLLLLSTLVLAFAPESASLPLFQFIRRIRSQISRSWRSQPSFRRPLVVSLDDAPNSSIASQTKPPIAFSTPTRVRNVPLAAADKKKGFPV